jgi:cytochrome c oxidase assembly factor CtaG
MLSFHLLQNVMLGDWAPALLLLGLTPAMVDAVGGSRLVAPLVRAPVAMGIWLAVWYGVHLPPVYDLALENHAVLGLEHVLFVASGLAFWWPEIAPGRLSPERKLWYLAFAFAAISPLDVAVYVWPGPLYGFYRDTPKLWGLDALSDQRLGAVVMALASYGVLVVASAAALRGLRRRRGPRATSW